MRSDNQPSRSPSDLYTRPKTPFVAQFIGRNTLIDGSLISVKADRARLSTAFGEFVGTPNDQAIVGQAVKIVVPSESLEIYPSAGATREALADEYQSNVLPGVMERADVVGHLVQMAITLSSAATVALEGLSINIGGATLVLRPMSGSPGARRMQPSSPLR
jgi:ABC-type Fe3+/spermidine/putrescine transport system ATPase subunit